MQRLPSPAVAPRLASLHQGWLCDNATSHDPAGWITFHGRVPPAGLLTSGLIPSVRHALDGLLTSDAILLPASATVYMQAVRRGTGNGMRHMHVHRYVHACGATLACTSCVPQGQENGVTCGQGSNTCTCTNGILHAPHIHAAGGAAHRGGVRAEDVGGQPVPLAPRLCGRWGCALHAHSPVGLLLCAFHLDTSRSSPFSLVDVGQCGCGLPPLLMRRRAAGLGPHHRFIQAKRGEAGPAVGQ